MSPNMHARQQRFSLDPLPLPGPTPLPPSLQHIATPTATTHPRPWATHSIAHTLCHTCSAPMLPYATPAYSTHCYTTAAAQPHAPYATQLQQHIVATIAAAQAHRSRPAAPRPPIATQPTAHIATPTATAQPKILPL
jgi:hypothetical protein